MSIVREGGYGEQTSPGGRASVRKYGPGQVIFRRTKTPHRLHIAPGKYALTLISAGPRMRPSRIIACSIIEGVTP
jgi:hypothetical protein